jgi:predicted nuclease with TOPRIM domain
MEISHMIALGSLIVAAIALIVGFVQRGKANVSRDQQIADKLDVQTQMMRDVKNTVDKLDGKLDNHTERITKIEAEQGNIYRRLDRLEGRCERHFGPSMHDKEQ